MCVLPHKQSAPRPILKKCDKSETGLADSTLIGSQKFYTIRYRNGSDFVRKGLTRAAGRSPAQRLSHSPFLDHRSCPSQPAAHVLLNR